MNINTDIEEIYNGIEYFIENLKKPKKDFSFFPALNGLTKDGQKLSLGFSCYALKIYYMLGKTRKIFQLKLSNMRIFAAKLMKLLKK